MTLKKQREIKVKTIYRHFKNNLYFVEDIAIDSEDRSLMVVYRALYGEYKLFVRSYDMFMEEVPEGKENPTGQKYRFMTSEEISDLI